MDALIDTGSYTTFVPATYYEHIMEQLMLPSVGYFFDEDLQSYVLSCYQRDIMESMYLRLDPSSGGTSQSNRWLEIQPIDFMKEIDQTN